MGKDNPTGKTGKRTYGRAERGTVHLQLPEEFQADYEQLIKNLEKFRLDRGIKKVDLAKYGIDSNHLRHWINFRHIPTIPKLLVWIKALGTTLPQILQYHKNTLDSTTTEKINHIEYMVEKLLKMSQNEDI